MKPRLFNGTEWIEFDTIEAHDAYISALPKHENPLAQAEELVQKRRARGQQCIQRFLVENASIDINIQDSIAQMAAFQNVKMALDVGDLGTAVYLISQIPDETFVLTPPHETSAARKQSYIDELLAPL